MADRKNTVEKCMIEHSIDEPNRSIPSPDDDCWELVGFPSSPSPEVVLDGLALLEPASSATCSSECFLHDDYFSCPSSSSKLNALPLSTAMAHLQGEHEVLSSTSADSLVSLDPDTEMLGNPTHLSSTSAGTSTDECKEILNIMRDGICMQYDNCMSHDENLRVAASICHDDSPYYMFLEGGEITCHQRILPAENEMYNHAHWHLNENSVNSVIGTIENVGVLETGCNAQQLSTLAMFEGLESSRAFPPMHGPSMEACGTSSEDFSSSAVLEGASRQVTAEVENSSDTQASLRNSCSIRHFKIGACASWLWTQLCGWQAQLGYANTVWSIAFAAAVVGILVLRRGLQRLQAQNYSLRSQVWSKEKRITQLIFQSMQAKDASARIRRVPVICMKSAF